MRRALIAEDDLISRDVMVCMLKDDFTLDIAENGSEALGYFRRAIEEKNPYSAIFLDVMMPGLNGRETLRIIRALEEEKGRIGSNSTKIIMTTALKDAENINTSFNDQADAYLVKPISMDELKGTLKELKLV